MFPAVFNKITKIFLNLAKMLITHLDTFSYMNFEEVALKTGLSKEAIILIAIEAALLAIAAMTGIPAEKIGKLPL